MGHRGARARERDRRERQPSEPLARKNASSSQATSFSVMPGWTNCSRCARPSVGRSRRRGSIASSSSRLDQPQRDDLVVHRMELDTGRGGGQCRPVGVGQQFGLHAERDNLEALEDRRQILADCAGREDHLPAECLTFGLLGVARICQQKLRIAGDEQRPWPGRLLLRHEAEAAEVALVRDPADQHPIELALVEDLAEACHARIGRRGCDRHSPAHSSLAFAMLALCSGRVAAK